VLSASGDVLVIDSGSGIAELGSAIGRGSAFDAHLLVTHTHWDHIQGFPFFAPNFVHGSRLTVVGPTGSSQSLQEAFTDQMRPSYFPMTLGEMPGAVEFIECTTDVEFEICGMTVTPKSLDHPIATFGYRIEEEGRSFVFCTDNEIRAAPPESLIEWCSGADLLVHDAQYSRDEYATRVGWGHSTFDAALELAQRAGVKRLAFFHHDPDHSDADIDRFVQDAIARVGAGSLVAFAAAECQEIELHGR
jgi:phosphoribosyl 1,2-cyclic phosphodiesterase